MKNKQSVCLELISDMAEKCGVDIKGMDLVEAVRTIQRHEGHFDCFAKAGNGFCDQNGCLFYEDCVEISINEQNR